MKIARKTTKRTFAISAAVPAIPPNPKIAAMIAMIKKISAYLNMAHHRLLDRQTPLGHSPAIGRDGTHLMVFRSHAGFVAGRGVLPCSGAANVQRRMAGINRP